MQIAAETAKFQSLPGATLSESSITVWQSRFSQIRMIRCNGAVASFEPSDIPVAVTKRFLAADGMRGAAFAGLQPQVIDDGISRSRYLGFRIGSAPSRAQFIGPIG